MTSYTNTTTVFKEQKNNEKPFPILRSLMYIALVLAAILFVADIVRRFFPQKETGNIQTDIPTRPTMMKNIESPPSLQSFQYTGQEMSFPKTIQFYSNEKRALFTTEELSVVASQIDLHPSTTNMSWQTEKREKTLTYQPSRNMIQYIAQHEITQTTIDYEEAIRISQAFLSAISLPQIYQPIPEKTVYMKSRAGEPIESSKNDSNLVEVVYGFSINEYPVAFESTTEPFVKVWVASPGVVVKAEIINTSLQPIQVGIGKTISIDSALKNMQTGSYTLLSYVMSGKEIFTAKSLQSATFTKVVIEYRVSNEGNSVFPYYRFSGTATAQGGGKASVEIITPAIETQDANPQPASQ